MLGVKKGQSKAACVGARSGLGWRRQSWKQQDRWSDPGGGSMVAAGMEGRGGFRRWSAGAEQDLRTGGWTEGLKKCGAPCLGYSINGNSYLIIVNSHRDASHVTPLSSLIFLPAQQGDPPSSDLCGSVPPTPASVQAPRSLPLCISPNTGPGWRDGEGSAVRHWPGWAIYTLTSFQMTWSKPAFFPLLPLGLCHLQCLPGPVGFLCLPGASCCLPGGCFSLQTGVCP